MTRTHNAVRFGVNVGTRSYAQALALCQAAEAAGFTTAGFADRPPDAALEGWTLSTAIGAMTKRLILTHTTLNVPFRNPGLTAKMAATLEAVTGPGRVELTLGAGAQRPHYEGYGIPFGTTAELFTGLRDAVVIMRGLWANETFTYEGKVYRTTNGTIGMRPATGRIPIWIGALGPQMMRYTGRVADGWMKNRGWPASIEELRGLVRLLEEGAVQAKRDPLAIRRVLNGGVAFGDAVPVAGGGSATGPFGPPNVTGSAQQMVDTFARYRDEGVDTFHLRFPEQGLLEHVRAFGEQVIGKVR